MYTKKRKMSPSQIFRQFPDNKSAEEWFISQRWQGSVYCPRCGGFEVSESRNARNKQKFRCRPCGKGFSTKIGSLMESSKFGFKEWAIAIYRLTTSVKEITDTKLADDLGVRQEAAWHLAMKIHTAYNGTSHLRLVGASPEKQYTTHKGKATIPRIDDTPENVAQSLFRANSVYGVGIPRLYNESSVNMRQCNDKSIALTVTSPPYWNAVDYDIHSKDKKAWHRKREYSNFGATYEDWLENIRTVFQEVYRVTIDGGFCAVVVGTILHKREHYPAPYDLIGQMADCGWLFHQDIIWNKVTGGVKRAGVFIQHPKAGYYYPNIMTEYILVFRKNGAVRRGNEEALPIDEVFKKDIANNIWHIAPIPPNTIDHPCPYPDELVRRLVLLYSQKGDEVLDPFLGSGQTALVALKHGRRAVGYDIEKSYIDLTMKRLNNPSSPRKHNLVARFDKVAV